MPEDTATSSHTKVMIIGAVAVVGWLLAIYFGVNGSRTEERFTGQVAILQENLTAQQAAVGMIDELEANIATLQPEVGQLSEDKSSCTVRSRYIAL